MLNSKNMTRQEFVGGVACASVALALGSAAAPRFASADGIDVAVGVEQVDGTQYGFWVEPAKCDNCGECISACNSANGIAEGQPARRKVFEYQSASGKLVYVTTSCMHCLVPSCATVCPAGAISKREEDGIVVVDSSKCIGCKYCFHACPFGVPNYTANGMDKCDCCLGNGAYPSGAPECVSACQMGAIHFGPIDELLAEAGEEVECLSASTGPSFLLS